MAAVRRLEPDNEEREQKLRRQETKLKADATPNLIQQLNARMDTLLDKIQTQHASSTVIASVHHVDADNVVQAEHIIKSLNPEGKIDGHPIDHMQRVLGVKRCLVILDGLEAIEYQDQQKDKTDLFGQFINAMGSSGLVITTTDGKQVVGQKLQLRPLEEGPVLLESLIERQDRNSSKELCDAKA